MNDLLPLENAQTDKPVTAAQDQRRRELVAATQRIIARYGLAGTTSARVAREAGLSPGIVNFYFASKERMLLAALEAASLAFITAVEGAVARQAREPGERLWSLIDAVLDPEILSADQASVWYAFWGEAAARADYLAVCGARDEAYEAALLAACEAVGETAPAGSPRPDPEAIAWALAGMVDQIWQTALLPDQPPKAEQGRRLIAGLLASVYPWRFAETQVAQPTAEGTATGSPLPLTLPGWTYVDAGFAKLEKQHLFLKAWHVVGHVSELTAPGDYLAFEGASERAFVVRGSDGSLRAFHNVCRHRAHALVSGRDGNCGKVIRCPYHGWVFSLEGRLKAMAAAASFPSVDRDGLGLIAIELEVFLGFVFIRFQGGEPSVAQRFAPYAEEMALYRSADMQPLGKTWDDGYPVDWKNQMDNYLEGYHVPVGHPGLYDLFGAAYENAPAPGGVARALHGFRSPDKPVAGWSTRHYRKLLPEVTHLPEQRRKVWSYYALFPYVALDFYPDQVDFFQVVPDGVGRSRLRSRCYALPDSRREMKLARYLNNRINGKVQDEDVGLIESVQAGLATGGYASGLLSDKEASLGAFHDYIRQRIPEAGREAPPQADATALATAERLLPRRAG
ncbi:MAG: hypothetical protein Kilf2KO_29620 [Rhodospirillales bacterium]